MVGKKKIEFHKRNPGTSRSMLGGNKPEIDSAKSFIQKKINKRELKDKINKTLCETYGV